MSMAHMRKRVSRAPIRRPSRTKTIPFNGWNRATSKITPAPSRSFTSRLVVKKPTIASWVVRKTMVNSSPATPPESINVLPMA